MNNYTPKEMEIIYQKAVTCVKQSTSYNQVKEARETLLSLGDYKDCAVFIDICDRYLANQPGNHVIFGNYKGKDLSWTILSTNGTSYLLLADDIVDMIPFHPERAEVTWNNCQLRKWLNRDFLESAFSLKDRMRIMLSKLDNQFDPRWSDSTGNGPDTRDKVYVFSLNEMLEYLPEKEDRNIKKWWWLRGHGYSNLTQKAIYEDGTIYDQGISCNSGDVGVRPVMLVRIVK